MNQISLGVEPSSINKFELGVEYIGTDDWITEIGATDSDESVGVSTSNSDLTIDLVVRVGENGPTVNIIGLTTTRMDRVSYKGMLLKDWSAQDFVRDLQSALSTKGLWNEGLFIGDLSLWFKSREKLDEIMVSTTMARGEHEIYDDNLVEKILATTNLIQITKSGKF